MRHYTCSHLRDILNRKEADRVIERCVEILTPVDFDTLAFSGNSGALIAPILAHKLNKEIIMVRKPGVQCASGFSVEGFRDSKKYVLVDDLISSGRTAERIVKAVQRLAPNAQMVGILLYAVDNADQVLYGPDTRGFIRIMEACAPEEPVESNLV